MSKTPAKPQNDDNARLKFKLNQQVVYPLHGVGKIVSIEKRNFKNKKLEYYILHIESNDMTIMIPVTRATDMGLRPIVRKQKIEQVLNFIAKESEPLSSDWKLRNQLNFDLLKKGSIMDIATIVRSLYHRKQQKDLPILERKIYDTSLTLLIDEVSIALKFSKQDSEDLIFEKLRIANDIESE